MASASWSKRWLRPEVYPLFLATGVAVSICAMQLIRNITGNPEVRLVLGSDHSFELFSPVPILV
jgi:hypothetical protein